MMNFKSSGRLAFIFCILINFKNIIFLFLNKLNGIFREISLIICGLGQRSNNKNFYQIRIITEFLGS